jgi:hypothetical protein
MTPKEKAEELINKFIRFHRNGIYNVVHEDIAKQYALIAVDEIINDNPNIYDSDRLNFKYWQKVKQEIKLL